MRKEYDIAKLNPCKNPYAKHLKKQTTTNIDADIIFLKTVARENRIPSELSADPFYSKENMEELERRVADIHSGKNTLKEHELIEVD